MLPTWLTQSWAHHQTMWVLGSYYVFSNAVSAMPTPSSVAGGFYRWLFDFSHLVSGNLTRVIATRFPQAANGGFTTGSLPQKVDPRP